MITPHSDSSRVREPSDQPTIPEDLVEAVARRSDLDTASARDMLTDFFTALDRVEALIDVDAPVPYTIVPGVIA